MNFSIPNEIKQAFNREFAGQNKSAIVAELMQQAVDRARQRRARHEAFAILTEERAQRGPLNGIQTRDAREAGRP